MESTSSEDSRPDPFLRWGVLDGPWLWSTRIRILFVLDGRISAGTDPGCFGLGYVLAALRDNAPAWWVDFDVTVVRRDDGKARTCSDGGPDEATVNFRFTQNGFQLDDYDQVWFFGDLPSNDTADPQDPVFSPLSDAELSLLADWMDRGGGVLAIGDHYDLGSSMCSRLPRVRTMRKWTVEQGVPPMYGPLRNQTLQPAAGYIDGWEGDAFPQTIEPVYQQSGVSIVGRTLTPHPLLCGPAGVIDKFPDHMHEGQVIDDDDVELDLPLDIPGYNRVEYPSAAARTLEADIAAVPIELPWRPRPHVIAYGRTTEAPGLFEASVTSASDAIPPRSTPSARRFGLISTYDGDGVGIGRVVVESTWHHWFSYNLYGFVDGNPPVLAGMQAYYRNVGLWLATPAQRRSMLFAAIWGVVVSDPMGFPPGLSGNVWAAGEKALDAIGRTATQCTISEFVRSFITLDGQEMFSVPDAVETAEPYPSFVPMELASRAMVGGIAAGLIEPAFTYRKGGAVGRRILDPETIVRCASDGAHEGYAALVAMAQTSVTAAIKIAGRLAAASRPAPHAPIPIPVELVRLRVVAERLQLVDPTDPALVDGRCTLTIRLSIAGTVVADEVIDDMTVPTFEGRGAFIDLSRVLYDGIVQSGEPRVLEVLAGRVGGAASADDQVRFSETVDEAPSAWIGAHTPARDQSWRLWYRVEHSDHDPGERSPHR